MPKSRKECNPDQERNPFTNRCNKKCSDGKIRNADFKCVFPHGRCPENREYSNELNRCVIKCKTNQIRNNRTGRCLKKCKYGFVRNKQTMKCEKRKPIKTPPRAERYPPELQRYIDTCPSHMRTPKHCNNFKRLSKIYDPDNNPGCRNEAQTKFNHLMHLCENNVTTQPIYLKI